MSRLQRRTFIRGAAASVAAPTVASLPQAASATKGRPNNRIRVLTWNIYQGGRGEGGADNLHHLLDQLVAIAPDVYLAVETYGSGPQIERALTNRAGKGTYVGVQITDAAAGSDNLWIFTHLPIARVFPKPTGELISDFNLGGIRLRLPRRRELDVFVVWSNYSNPWDGYLIDENAAGIRAGLTPRHSVDDVVHAGRVQTAHLREIVDVHLPHLGAGEGGRPVIIGGDFNTLPAADWTSRWADTTNHFGMSYSLTATKVVTDSGFVDTFRAAHRDAVVEGRTWSPLPRERLITPQRIDMIFAKGNVAVRAANVIDTRMPQHGPGTFYSDHAAVTADLAIG